MHRASVLAVAVGLGALVACDGGSDRSPSNPEKQAAAKPSETKDLGNPDKGEAKVEVIRPEAKPDPLDAVDAEPPAENPEDLIFAEPGKAYGQVMVQTRSETDHIAELTIVRAEGVKARSGMVKYTAEPRVLVAKGSLDIDESNLLGSGLALDIDGDGKTTSKLRSKCEGAAAVIQTKPPVRLDPVTELSEDVARFDYGADASRILSRDDAGAVLYAPCDAGRIVLGFDPKAPLKMHSVASPSVFVVYRAEVDTIDAEDPFSLKSLDAGESPLEHELYPFREVSVEDGTVKIYAAHLIVFALDAVPPLQHVAVTISGQQPEFATASINEVDADGHRIRYGDGFKPFQGAK